MENTEKKPAGQFIELGNNRIRYYEEGQGETILMIHGLGQAMYTFRKNVHALSEYCHVVTIDLLGHGLSDKPEDNEYTIEDYSQLIADFMDAMGIEHATVMGFSTGAVIVLDLAIRFPGYVDRLILLSPGGPTKTYPPIFRRLTTPLISDILFTIFNKGMIRSVLKEAYYDPRLATQDVINHYHKVLADHDALEAVAASLAAWNDAPVSESLSRVTVPAYIFWGENDQWHPIDMMEYYEDALSDVYSATFAECGHLLHEERAEELNKKLIEIMALPLR